LAERYTATVCPFLAIMHGVSGSGKTVLSETVVEQCGAIRIRSDVERKRLHGLTPVANSYSKIDQGIYSVEATKLTFDYIADTALQLITCGYSVIIDATFLAKPLRDQFRVLAKDRQVPFVIFDCKADEATLVKRLHHRNKNRVNASEADLAIMQKQLTRQDCLSKQEQPFCFSLKANVIFSKDDLLNFIDNQRTLVCRA
jgi:predicted kinase